MANNTVVETVSTNDATARVAVYSEDAVDTICMSIREVPDRFPCRGSEWAFADLTPEQARIVGQALLNFADSKC